MTSAVVFLFLLLVVALVTLFKALQWYYESNAAREQAVIDYRIKVVELATATAHSSRVEGQIEDLRMQHLEEISRLREDHFRHIERLSAEHQRSVETLGKMAAFGTAHPQPAVVDTPEEPEGRIMRQVTEESVERGAAALKERYRDAGINLTDEEARRQAESMLLLRPPIALGA